MILLLPGLLGAWKVVSGESIDRRHVERIQDGKTTKNEILLLFGDPQEIDRAPEGVTYTYKSFKDTPAMPYRPENRKINPQSDQIYVINEDKQIKKAPLKTEGKILKSTLLIRFKPDGQTVMSHEYKEF
jgi:outer membrane protein assembly factor BamE (lipoprotein component of BamABCDE complex)